MGKSDLSKAGFPGVPGSIPRKSDVEKVREGLKKREILIFGN
jgi:hypothetical protein